MSLLFDLADGPLVDIEEYEASVLEEAAAAERERLWTQVWEPHVHIRFGPNICFDCGWLS